ncbi:MAG: hypothetical protein ABIS18_05110 [Actinomycetota bacterium]
MSRLSKVVVGALLVASTFAPSAGFAAAPVFVGPLSADSTLFWDGGYVGSSPTYSLPLLPPNAALDRCALVEPCFNFQFDVVGSGARLRVAFDTPMRDDGFEITYTSPSGVVTRRSNSNQYSVENFFLAPELGRWTVKVAPYGAEHASFRMRAKLESTPYVPPGEGALPPNLRVTRQWEFGFVAPANPGNGLFPPDDTNPPLEVAGQHPLSCSVDETLDDGTSRCLRFSFGLANVGDGTFDIRFMGDRSGAEFAMTQCVQQSSGSPVARPAGKGKFHTTHGHFHYHNIIFHKLHRVTDRSTGAMTQVGAGKKLGYSPADQGIAEWTRFVQAPSGSSGGFGNCASASDSNRLGMSSGWGDAYRYQRPGNFIDFTAGSDGYFVVQTIADPENVVLESNESDNTSYAYLRIVGEEVDVLESGVGASPWDPNKIVYN